MRQRLIRLEDVMKMTALSRSSIYACIAEGRFPKPLRIGRRAVAWRESEILNWISSRQQA